MLKVCWVGRYALVRHADKAVAKKTKAGFTTYDYDLLVACIARVLDDRHNAIEWVHKHVIPVSEDARPGLKIIYK